MSNKQIQQQDFDVEKAVLGAMLLDPQGLIKALDILPVPECFSTKENQVIYATIQKMNAAGKAVDTLTLAQALKKEGCYTNIGGPAYLTSLASKISSAAHIELHGMILLERFIRMQMNRLMTDGLKKSISDQEDIFEVTEYVQKGVSDILTNNLKSSELTMEDRIRIERENRNKTQEAGITGIPTGSKKLDELTGGFVSSDLWIIGGRPGSGKTSWLVSTMKHLALSGVPVGVISLEMSGEQLTQRLISNHSEVDATKLRNSQRLTVDDRIRLENYEPQIAKLPIHISDPAIIRSQSIRTKAHIWKRKYGIKVLFVDYIQKIVGTPINTKFGNRDQEMGEVSGTLKAIAKELGITVVCLASLNREVEKRADKIPQLSDLRDSGNIESDADQVLFLMRPEYYGLSGHFFVGDKELPVEGLAVGSLAKNRHGDVGEFPYRFEKTIMRFSDYDRPQLSSTQFPITNRLTAIAHEF
jgi:replicative DNA helicase